MSKLICHATYYANIDQTLIVAISASFQAVFSPWIPTVAAESDLRSSTAEINVFAMAPTFQFTRSLGVWLGSVDEEREFLESDLLAPLYSHLQRLELSYNIEDEPSCPFENGDAVAKFVLRFRRLTQFAISVAPELTSPTELISSFYITLFRNVVNNSQFFMFMVSFDECFSGLEFRDRNDEFQIAVKQNGLCKLFAERTIALYQQDHGATLSGCLETIVTSYSGARDSVDPTLFLDDLEPVFDLIQAIVLNGDLLHPCFYEDGDVTNKFKLTSAALQLIAICLHYDESDCLNFMERYGRTSLPRIGDTIFSQYDDSGICFVAMYVYFFVFNERIIADRFWTEDVDDRLIVSNGRKMLEHFPFAQLPFALKYCSKSLHDGLNPISDCVANIANYVFDVAQTVSNEDAEKSDVVRVKMMIADAASRLNEQRIPELLLALVTSLLDRSVEERALTFVSSGMDLMNEMIDREYEDDLVVASRKSFFGSADDLQLVVTRIENFSQMVYDIFQEEYVCFFQEGDTNARWDMQKKCKEGNEAARKVDAHFRKLAAFIVKVQNLTWNAEDFIRRNVGTCSHKVRKDLMARLFIIKQSLLLLLQEYFDSFNSPADW